MQHDTLLTQVKAEVEIAFKLSQEISKAYVDKLYKDVPLSIARNRAIRTYQAEPSDINHRSYQEALRQWCEAELQTKAVLDTRTAAFANEARIRDLLVKVSATGAAHHDQETPNTP